jgi:hypothetical protein
MTNPNYTHISILVDRSGSMTSLTNDTIGGFNSFLAEQKKLNAGRATVSFATFASDYTLVHDFIDLQNVPELTTASYRTDGMTALFDSIVNLTNTVGSKLAAMREEDRPGKVVVVIITDGEENRSIEFKNFSKVKVIIDHQTTKYNWLYVYPANSVEKFHSTQSQSIGISGANTAKFANTSVGTRSLYRSVSANMAQYRLSDDIGAAASYDFFQMDKQVADADAQAAQPTITTPAVVAADITPPSSGSSTTK